MNNRDMFYQNLNQGYQNPGMIYPPSGYNLNQEYQAYGPNVMPYNNGMNGMNNNMNNNMNNDLEDRISKLERQIKTLDTRIQKLESVSNEINDNIYMI